MQKEVREIIEELINKVSPEKIIIFGSRVWKGKGSDIDFLIIKKGISGALHNRIYRIRKKLPLWATPVDLLILTPEEVERYLEIEDPFIRKVMEKGKVIYQA